MPQAFGTSLSFSTDSDMLSWHCMPLHLYFSFHPTFSFSVSTWCLGCALSLIGFSQCVWSHTYSRYMHRSHGGWEAAQRIGIKLHKGQTRHERDEWHTLSARMSAASRSEPGQWRRWGAYFSWAGPPAAPKPSAPLLSSSLPLHMRKTLVLSGKIRQHLPRRLVRYVSCKPDVECKCHRPRSRSLSRGCWTTWSSSRCVYIIDHNWTHRRRTWTHQETQTLNQRGFSYKEG